MHAVCTSVGCLMDMLFRAFWSGRDIPNEENDEDVVEDVDADVVHLEASPTREKGPKRSSMTNPDCLLSAW